MCADAALQVLLAARTAATAICMCPLTSICVYFLQGQVWRRELGYLLQNCPLCLLPGHSLGSLFSSDKTRDFLVLGGLRKQHLSFLSFFPGWMLNIFFFSDRWASKYCTTRGAAALVSAAACFQFIP